MERSKFTTHVLTKILVLIVVLTMVFGSMASISYGESENKTIRVGCFPLNGFFDIADDGTVSGYGADYTDIIFKHIGWNYKYVKYSSWVSALDGLSNNEIDILAPAQHTAQRDARYEFDSFPIGTEYGALLALNTRAGLVYEDYEKFNKLNVGCVKTGVFLDDFEEYEKNNGFKVNLTYYKDTPALTKALNVGEVDAILANMMVKTDSMKLLARFGASPFYYMLSPNSNYLLSELNKGIDKVSSNHPELQNELNAMYFSDFTNIPFSREELDYIHEAGTLNVACGSCYPPFSYVNEKTGKIDGVDYAILNEISKITGLKFQCKPIPLDGKAKEFMKKEKIVLAAGVENDDDTQLSGSDFTDSYLSVSKYFIGPKTSNLDTRKALNIAVVTAADSQLKTWGDLYPAFKFKRYESIDKCIQAIRDGDADFMLDDRYSMERMLSAPKNADLQIFNAQVINSSISFKVLATGKDADILTSIINKTIKKIPETDKERFISDYTQANRYKYSFADFLYQYRLEALFVVLLICVVAVAMYFVIRVRRRASVAIKENEMKLRNITNNINGGVIVLKANEGLDISYANDGFLDLIGCTREEFNENESYLAYVHPDDYHKIQQAIDSNEAEMSLELRVLKASGAYVPALFNCTCELKKSGERELYCVILDMTEQNKLLEQLKIDKHRTDLILDRVDEIFYEINMEDFSVTTSNSFLVKMGWTLPDKIPEDTSLYGEIWHTDEANLEKLRISTDEMEATKAPVSQTVLIESKLENRMVWCRVFQYPVLSDDGRILTVIGLIRNIDKQVTEREKLIEQVQRDSLTGLYNKEAFETIVREELIEMPDDNHALIFIDLDRFKSLNDTLGHLMGDHAICEAADKLKVIFANYDIISRFGGDEFCIFVKNIPIATLREKMDWLINKIHQDYHGEKGDIHITCSCGVACTEQVGYDYETLMKFADKALYYSKETGRDRYTFCTDILDK